MFNLAANLSQNKKRNQCYHAFLALCRNKDTKLKHLIRLGSSLMRQEKLYHHFFANHSLRTLATHLALFSLKLPYDYTNKSFLNRKLSEQEARAIIHLFERRIAERKPLAYLTQETPYLKWTFYVNEAVLVPRSLMNTRFEEFLAAVPWENYRVLDMGSGSGCIGLSLALLDPKIKVDLVDISAAALEVAKRNVDRYALASRVRCIQSDLFAELSGSYDLIITNPPYVTDREYQRQPEEIKNEPALALEGGSDGLEVFNRILIQASAYLNPKGLLIAELGYTATKLLKKRYPSFPFQSFCYKKPQTKQGLWNKLGRLTDLPFEWSGYLDGVILWERKNLPTQLSYQSYPLKSLLFRLVRFMKTRKRKPS